MINNRQTGRRRGRNNPRQNGGGNRGSGDSGNRIDNRARGNAAQLLEKYRNMARDAQMAGDRVNCEYYLQFADHYFRVLADNRARQEEQQARFRRPGDNDQDDDFVDEGDGFGDLGDGGRGYEPQRNPNYGGYSPQRSEPAMTQSDEDESAQPSFEPSRQDQRADDRGRDRDRAQDRVHDQERERTPRPRRPRREPAAATASSEPEASGFDAALLPPSIGRPVESADEAVDAPAPKRTRRARPSAQAAE